jgi:hypothetical protein
MSSTLVYSVIWIILHGGIPTGIKAISQFQYGFSRLKRSNASCADFKTAARRASSRHRLASMGEIAGNVNMHSNIIQVTQRILQRLQTADEPLPASSRLSPRKDVSEKVARVPKLFGGNSQLVQPRGIKRVEAPCRVSVSSSTDAPAGHRPSD